VSLAARLNTGPKVFPPSWLILITGSFDVWLFSHHVTNTSFPDAAISALMESDPADGGIYEASIESH
jgi:hypothetical protein